MNGKPPQGPSQGPQVTITIPDARTTRCGFCHNPATLIPVKMDTEEKGLIVKEWAHPKGWTRIQFYLLGPTKDGLGPDIFPRSDLCPPCSEVFADAIRQVISQIQERKRQAEEAAAKEKGGNTQPSPHPALRRRGKNKPSRGTDG